MYTGLADQEALAKTDFLTNPRALVGVVLDGVKGGDARVKLLGDDASDEPAFAALEVTRTRTLTLTRTRTRTRIRTRTRALTRARHAAVRSSAVFGATGKHGGDAAGRCAEMLSTATLPPVPVS